MAPRPPRRLAAGCTPRAGSLAAPLFLGCILAAGLAAEPAPAYAGSPPTFESPPPVGDYVFDSVPRKRSAKKGEKSRCPTVDLMTYEGTHLPLNRPVELDRRFVPHIRNFEAIAVEAALEVYGRAPQQIVHRGGYRCRSVTGRKGRWSEHAFGNALDVIGFDFGPASSADADPPSSAASDSEAGQGAGDDPLAGAFEVRIGDHWRSTRGASAQHARFLHLLTRRLIERHVFRIILGPGDPGHETVLHIDYGPTWYLRVDLPEPDPEPAPDPLPTAGP